jgi:hypothetical protein
MNSIKNVAVCFFATVLVSACASTKTAGVHALSKESAAVLGLKDVTILDQSGSNSPTLVENAKKGLSDALAKCMKGTTPTNVEMTITGYKAQNGGMTWLIGSGTNMTGTAKFTDAATGQELGTYNVSRNKIGMGLVGIAYLSGSEVGLPNGMGEDLCTQVFKVKTSGVKKT